jgi:UDP-4-amino-4,6-dideoxy-N-acetyl-beta-L-altrosamine transaminase
VDIPYSCQNIQDVDVESVVASLRSDFLTQGPCIPEFESRFAACHGVKYAVAVANATAALHLGCLALGAGPGKRVWTSPNSFVASANCALYCGSTIGFVDIDPATRNISVEALRARLKFAESAGELPDIVIPVDFAGLPCDMQEIRVLADQYGFKILQDASHAVGAEYLGKPVGSAYADATVFSFHAVKVVTTGEGGIIVTNNQLVEHELRLLRSHGITRDPSVMASPTHGPWYYQQVGLGFNYRLTDFQAALGMSQLGRLQEMHMRRVFLAERYDQMLGGLPLRLPVKRPDRVSSWHLYVVEIDAPSPSRHRQIIFSRLRDAGIGVNVHYIPIHTQPYFQRLGFKLGDFPNAEEYYDGALSLPLFPRMTTEQQDYVVGVMSDALRATLSF